MCCEVLKKSVFTFFCPLGRQYILKENITLLLAGESLVNKNPSAFFVQYHSQLFETAVLCNYENLVSLYSMYVLCSFDMDVCSIYKTVT